MSKDENLSPIYSAFMKHEHKLTGLFFTTTSEALKGKIIQHSPPEMSKRFFFFGRFDAHAIEEQLRKTRVDMSQDAISALVQISGVHRGVFVRLCQWVEKQQKNSPQKVCLLLYLKSSLTPPTNITTESCRSFFFSPSC